MHLKSEFSTNSEQKLKELESLYQDGRWPDFIARANDFIREFGFNRTAVNRGLDLSRRMNAVRLQKRDGTVDPNTLRVDETNIWQSGMELVTEVFERCNENLANDIQFSLKDEKGRLPDKSKSAISQTEIIAPNLLVSESKIERMSIYDEFEDLVKNGSGYTFVCEGVTKGHRHNSFFCLNKVSFKLKTGQITGVVGANGSGKTTLLRIVAGHLLPDLGHYSYPMFSGMYKDWFRIRRLLGYVEQSPSRWPGTLRDHLSHSAATAGVPTSDIDLWIDHVLERLDLTIYKNSRWIELSGGYRMRSELARVMSIRTPLVIFDEPLAPLDLLSQQKFLNDLTALAESRRYPLSIILSTQHLHEVEAVADQMIVIHSNGEVGFIGQTNTIGETRKHNHVEITIDQTLPDLLLALGGLEAEAASLSRNRYILRLSLSISVSEVIQRLTDPFPLAYRDISRSTRKYLLADDPSLVWHAVS